MGGKREKRRLICLFSDAPEIPIATATSTLFTATNQALRDYGWSTCIDTTTNTTPISSVWSAARTALLSRPLVTAVYPILAAKPILKWQSPTIPNIRHEQ